MSVEESGTISESSLLAPLQKLEDKLQPITNALAADDFASPSVKSVYIEAEQRLVKQTKEAVLCAGSQAIRGFEQLDLVRELADEAEVTAAETELRRTINAAAGFFDRYGATTEEAQRFREQAKEFIEAGAGEIAVAQAVEVPAPGEEKVEPAESLPAEPAAAVQADAEAHPADPAVSHEVEPGAKKPVNFVIRSNGLKINESWITINNVGSNIETKARLIECIANLKPGEEVRLERLHNAIYPHKKYDGKVDAQRIRRAVDWCNHHAESAIGEPLLYSNGEMTHKRRYHKNDALDINVTRKRGRGKLPRKPESPVASGEEAPKSLIKLEIDDDTVRIGRRKPIAFEKSVKDGNKGYKIPKRKGLEFLLQNQGKKVSPHELWLAMFGPDVEFNRFMMKPIRAFYTDRSLLYKGKPIVEFSGQRGRNTWYGIGIESGLEVEWTNKSNIQPGSEDKSRADKDVASAEQAATKEPLTSKDVYVVAAHLRSFSFLFRHLGWKTVTGKTVEALRRQGPRGYNPSSMAPETRELREQAIARLESSMENADEMSQLIEELCEKKEQNYKVFEFLLQFDDPEAMQMLKTLSTAEYRRSPTGEEQIINKEGLIIWPHNTRSQTGDIFPRQKALSERAARLMSLLERFKVADEAEAQDQLPHQIVAQSP